MFFRIHFDRSDFCLIAFERFNMVNFNDLGTELKKKRKNSRIQVSLHKAYLIV
jgi:hypothetical protein